MSEIPILNAPVYPHGYVTGRYLTAVADGPDDDHLMDFTPAKGRVIFTPETVIRRHEGPSPALVVQRPVECPINSQGYLTSPDGWRGVSLITGIYSVRFDVEGAQVPGPKRIEVKASHTEDAPLDLVLSMPEVVPPGSVVVVDETTAQRAESAAARAEAAVARAEGATADADRAEAAAARVGGAAEALTSLGVTVTRTEVGRNEVMDPLFKGNGWTGWQGRQTWTVADGTATVKTNVETGVGNPLFEGVATVGQAAPAKDGDVWSMSVVVGVPASAPGPLTLRAGVAYGPASPTTLSFSHTQTLAPGESKTFTVQNNATPAGRTTAFVTVRSGQVIPAGSVMTVSKPVLTKGPTVGEFIHGDMAPAGDLTYAWEGTPHASASVKTRTTVSRPAVLDFIRDPATGDIHRGGEVIVTNDNADRLLSGLVANEAEGAVSRLITDVKVETVARNEVADPLFKGNGWTGWQGRQTWTVADGTATVKTNVETGVGNPLFEGVATVGQAAPAKDGDVWSMSVVVGVPASAPGPLTLRAGVAYGPASPTTLSFSHTQTLAPGESKTFTVQNNATPAGRTTAFVTVRSGQVIPAGSVMTVSKPVLTKGPTVGEFIHGDMAPAGDLTYAWEGTPHASASVKTRTTVSRPAVLEFVRDPATGDMRKGDEVILTGNNAARLLSGVLDVPETVPRGGLEARAATATPVSSSYTSGALTADRTRVYTSLANPPRYSDDDGQTWTDLTLIPGGVSVESTLLLDDGEMLVTGLVGAVSRRRVWRSEGLETGSPTWVQVLEAPFAGIKFTQAWSQSTHGRIVLVNEYGPKAGMPWPGFEGNVPRGEAAVRTYLSMDYGRTFKVIFNLHDWVTAKGGRSNSDMQHLHGVAWDPYWDRIWITYGDGMGGKGSNGVIFSDDLGASWQFAHHTPEGSQSSFQVVGIQPMPRCVLMFGDTTPAVMRIDRAHGKHTGTYPVDVAHDSTAAGSPKHLCQGFYRGRREGDDAPLLAAFSTEGGTGQDFIVATLDGYKFTEVWRGATGTPAGWGVRNPVGPTIRGQFLAATNANGGTTGQWATIRIPATGY